MKQFPQVTFNVTCIPYFLQVELPEEGVLFDDYIKSRYGDLKSFKRGEQGLVQMGRKSGIEFKFADNRRLYPSQQAHRFIQFVQKSGGNALEAYEAVDHRYFEEQKRVDEVDVLVDAAKELGLDTVAVKEHLSGKDGLQDMMDNFRRFMSGEGRKVGGVPHFYIYSDPAKKQELHGAQPTTAFTEVFARLAK